ncbi:MAG: CotH kinase family protein [Oscillospiraceae bacterium]|nr:CotH kinase family protein [Oscillospiraceae bacterium]
MRYPHRKLTLLLLSILCITMLSACSEQSSPSSTAETPAQPSDAVSGETASASPEDPFDAEGMHFSMKSGFYDSAFSLTITAPEGSVVYYTLDGSTPTAQSLRYEAPIPIYDRSPEENTLSMHTDIAQPAAYAKRFLPQKPVDKATVVRAVAVDTNGNESGVVTNTYFVGSDEKASYYQDTKIVSLVMDEGDLFDYAHGIYVTGKVFDDWKNGADYDPETPDFFMPGNYTQKGREWERPATIQFYEQGGLAASQTVGIRIHGGATRSYPQKSLKVFARREYGAVKLSYDLFSGNVKTKADGSALTEFDSFLLRNGGNDAQYTRFSDKLVQSLVADRQFLTQGMEPCIVFINGEFWGHYELTEKLDKDFVSDHYGIPGKDICIIKKEALEDGSEAGFADWEQLWQWIRETDLSDQAAYDELCSRVDMQGFMDYVSTEIYINNADWGKPNMAMWKAETVDASNPNADGKWRFILYDTEYSAGIYGQAQPDEDSFRKLRESGCFLGDLFNAALWNDRFREQFRATFLEIAEQNFDADSVNAEIDRLSERYHDMTIDTYDRFWSKIVGGYGAESNYKDAVDSLRSFYAQRYDYITAYLEECTSK